MATVTMDKCECGSYLMGQETEICCECLGATMSKAIFVVAFACNNERGNFTGKFENVNVCWDGGTALELELVDGPLALSYPKEGVIRVSGKNYPYLSSKEWYGNMCWNMVTMYSGPFVHLMNHLRKRRKNIVCTGGKVEPCQVWELNKPLGLGFLLSFQD